jgi:hypothetical protein
MRMQNSSLILQSYRAPRRFLLRGERDQKASDAKTALDHRTSLGSGVQGGSDPFFFLWQRSDLLVVWNSRTPSSNLKPRFWQRSDLIGIHWCNFRTPSRCTKAEIKTDLK